MAYRRRQQVSSSSSTSSTSFRFEEEEDKSRYPLLSLQSDESLAAKAIRASSAHRDSSLSSAYAARGARLLSASIDCPSSPPSSRRRKAVAPPHKTHEPESHFEQAPEQEEFPDDDRLEETPGPRATAPPEPPPRRRPRQISVYAAEAQIHQPLPVQIPGATRHHFRKTPGNY
ncbi:hypothetical protein ACFX11_038031 [Malus domestica]